MKKRYLALPLIGAALFTWSCDDGSTASPITPESPSASSAANASFPYYVDGGYLIDPSNGIVYEGASGTAIGQLTINGTVISIGDGATILFNADTTTLPNMTDGGLLLNRDGSVSSVDGTISGTLNPDGASVTLPDGSIIDLNGNQISAGTSSAGANPSSSSEAILPESSTTIDPNSSESQNPIESSSGTEIASSSSVASLVQGTITYTDNLKQTVAQGSTISTVVISGMQASPSRQSWNLWFINDGVKYDEAAKTLTIAATVPEYFQTGEQSETWIIDGTAYTLTLNIVSGSSTVSSSSTEKSSSSIARSSSSQARSSSSIAKSSSSIAKSSSSVARSSSSYQSGTSTELKKVSGGASGSGWATRYWDCCKPSCSWTDNAGSGNEARTCSASGSLISDLNATSICNGGSASTCTSQIPIIVNDNLAYAFAAVPASNGGACGKCFALEFTGTGKYETKNNHKALAGKTLVVMASNVGTDVAQGQFDVMIPGGGVGIYNGCSAFGWGSQGEQYGGLLSDCEKSVGYSATGNTLATKRKQCLTEKCNSVFANDSKAKEGCLFLATWMEAAGNPNHNYYEVECPAALKAQY